MGLQIWERPPFSHIWAREWKDYIREGIDLITNPFKSGEYPVEKAQMHAKKTSDCEDLAGFKQDRAAIIAYLEPQYQRLVLASNSIVALSNRRSMTLAYSIQVLQMSAGTPMNFWRLSFSSSSSLRHSLET
jgi:hypothetical protein